MRLEGLSSWGSSGGGLDRRMGFGGPGGGRVPPVLIAVFAFFVIFAVGSVIILSMGKEQPAEEAPQQPQAVEVVSAVEMEEIVVPVRMIEAGQPLDPGSVARISMPRNAVPVEAVRVLEEVNGMFAKSNLEMNRPIMRPLLTKERPSNAVVANIPEGFRAVTINVDATTGVEGWARAGAHVDVEWITWQNGPPTILTVVNNAKIISAERRLNPNSDPGAPVPATVTLLVTELDAQKITLTANSGKIVLHMRGSGDNDISEISSVVLNLSDLFNGGASEDIVLQGVAKIRRPDGTVEEFAVIRGDVMKKN